MKKTREAGGETTGLRRQQWQNFLRLPTSIKPTTSDFRRNEASESIAMLPLQSRAGKSKRCDNVPVAKRFTRSWTNESHGMQVNTTNEQGCPAMDCKHMQLSLIKHDTNYLLLNQFVGVILTLIFELWRV